MNETATHRDEMLTVRDAHIHLLSAGSGEPVLYLSNPRGIDRTVQRDSLDTLERLNRLRLGTVGDPEIATRINSFEMAYRMQASAPELMDLSRETKQTLEMYGAQPGAASFHRFAMVSLACWVLGALMGLVALDAIAQGSAAAAAAPTLGAIGCLLLGVLSVFAGVILHSVRTMFIHLR